MKRLDNKKQNYIFPQYIINIAKFANFISGIFYKDNSK